MGAVGLTPIDGVLADLLGQQRIWWWWLHGYVVVPR
jgi:hypothetical protein